MDMYSSRLKNITPDEEKGHNSHNESPNPVVAIKRDISEIVSLSKTSYFYFIPLSIYVVRVLAVLSQEWAPGHVFVTLAYITPFIERFGVVYGILLPLILVRAWEQLDDIDREFDREADGVKNLYNEIFFLRGKNEEFVKDVATSLRKYVQHVIKKYPLETKKLEVERANGDRILEEVREKFKEFIRLNGMRTKEEETFIPRFIEKLNDIVDIRGDRIALASQRLFESLHIVSLIASVIFVLPFYFVSFTADSGLLDNLLTAGVTLLVLIIYLFLEDFDEPFAGIFKISDESWHRLLQEMDSPKRKNELESLGKLTRKTDASWRTRRADEKKGVRKKKSPIVK